MKQGFQKGYTPWNKGKKSPSIGRKGRIAWNKGLKGYKSGEVHYNWKGNNVGYVALHKWIYKVLGQPNKCSECGKIGNGRSMNWANKSQEYKREVSDWIRLCPKCHKNYDRNYQGNYTIK